MSSAVSCPARRSVGWSFIISVWRVVTCVGAQRCAWFKFLRIVSKYLYHAVRWNKFVATSLIPLHFFIRNLSILNRTHKQLEHGLKSRYRSMKFTNGNLKERESISLRLYSVMKCHSIQIVEKIMKIWPFSVWEEYDQHTSLSLPSMDVYKLISSK